jgi:hypothetical protein
MSKLNIKEIQEQHRAWLIHNFGERTDDVAPLGGSGVSFRSDGHEEGAEG